MSMLDASGNRHKGRLPSQMRPLLSERAVLESADGSAKWVQEGSAVLVAVQGPTQAGQRREDAERAVLQVAFRPRNGLPGSQEREYEELLQGLLEQVVLLSHHPRTLIVVVVQVLQADGSLLAVALNAVCAALVDAGVPLRCMFAAVCCAFSSDGSLVIDPDEAEEQIASSVITVAYPASQKLAAADAAADTAAGGSGDQPPPQQQQQQQQQQRQLCVPDDTLLVSSRGSLQVAQLALALHTARQGCEGVSRFAHLALTHSFREALVKSQDPAV